MSGEAIPLPMRIVHVSHDMEALGRHFSPERALEAAHERRGETYDPAVADVFLAHGRDWFERLEPYLALWWVPAGTLPSVEEAKRRLARLDRDGPGPEAFTFRAAWPPPA